MAEELAARIVQESREDDDMPPDFLRSAGPAFLGAILEPSYCFSCDELLLIAEAARTNAIITQDAGAGAGYEVVGTEFGHPGPVAVICLEARGDRRARSNFSRLCLADTIAAAVLEYHRQMEERAADAERRARAEAEEQRRLAEAAAVAADIRRASPFNHAGE